MLAPVKEGQVRCPVCKKTCSGKGFLHNRDNFQTACLTCGVVFYRPDHLVLIQKAVVNKERISKGITIKGQ